MRILLESEGEILRVLNFDLNKVTPLDFFELFTHRFNAGKDLTTKI